MIYNHNEKIKLPNSISSVLGDKFNHGILFSYLRSIKYFDLIWTFDCLINNQQDQVEPAFEWFEMDGDDNYSMHLKQD